VGYLAALALLLPGAHGSCEQASPHSAICAFTAPASVFGGHESFRVRGAVRVIRRELEPGRQDGRTEWRFAESPCDGLSLA